MLQATEQVDPRKFKGYLPTYMKQGIPPYLQILFAARPPLPYLPPLRKPPRHPVKGFFEELDYDRICEELRLRRQAAVEAREGEGVAVKGASEGRVERWRAKMDAHVRSKEVEWRRWLSEEKMNAQGKSLNPFNTLVVAGLVASSAA